MFSELHGEVTSHVEKRRFRVGTNGELMVDGFKVKVQEAQFLHELRYEVTLGVVVADINNFTTETCTHALVGSPVLPCRPNTSMKSKKTEV